MSPFSKKSKKLIVSGCSYTDDCHDYPVWPELLAEKLKMDCINLGHSGHGNEYICSSILDTIPEHKNIGLVIPMWSEFLRLDFYNLVRLDEDSTNHETVAKPQGLGRPWVVDRKQQYMWISMHFPAKFGLEDRHENDWKNTIMRDLHNKGFGTDLANIRRSLRIFYMFQQTMKSLNIPFLQLMGPHPISRYNNKVPKEWCNVIIDSHYLNLIDKKLFLGWPMLIDIGGWSFDSFLDDYEYEDVRTSLDDCHPNAKGHSLISKKIYKYYENVYGTVF